VLLNLLNIYNIAKNEPGEFSSTREGKNV
jgi:hypothetical protein